METYRIGLDIGSTTAKIVVLNDAGHIAFSRYKRHHADIQGIISAFFDEVKNTLGDCNVLINITGSIGMGVAERFSLPFIQEVIAATEFAKKIHPEISTIIDIGGEDAKIVYLNPNGTADLRMNGNCAGGTGAFIDQMALLLGTDIENMNNMALQAQRKYPIASRCGVFSKTDVQNLLSKNVEKADVAASIFHAVAVQTIVTLSHGCEIIPKIMFCGGPLTFIPALNKAFVDYLQLSPTDFVLPENANNIPAWGAALSAADNEPMQLTALINRLNDTSAEIQLQQSNRLEPVFSSEDEYRQWKNEKNNTQITEAPLEKYTGNAYLGIDSGSTTTKIVVTDDDDRILFSFYKSNNGNSVSAVEEGLAQLKTLCAEKNVALKINSSFSTGYGEDLVKAAFGLSGGIIETIAHYVAARKINPAVSFILDIGGQDMKAIFVDNGVLSRMEINEACSSGCGSFIETFAHSLDYPLETFAHKACMSQQPCDLGTRCTVFMNSKVKQVLREGATVDDIAAGLSYSVIKNCLYKVLKLKKAEELGDQIVVQGGTMRNDSVVRALEQLIGKTVNRSNMPELMGAYGCALYAKSAANGNGYKNIDDLLATAGYTTREIQCNGCENLCRMQRYLFANKKAYYSGNKCEKVFSNNGSKITKGRNLSIEKNKLLFDRKSKTTESRLTIGIPRCLNMFENYPFWHTLLDECGIRTVLSSPSTFEKYESGVHTVMSDNICFPAKLVHSHIYDLVGQNVDRILFPYVVFEKPEGKNTANSYNCPIVSGYSEVIKSAINPRIPVDSPVITFKDKKQLKKCCIRYLSELNVEQKVILQALEKAISLQEKFEKDICDLNKTVYSESKAKGQITVLLAGRPYHTDPLVQHKLSEMIAGMGVTVITEDISRGDDSSVTGEAHLVSQWAYINRILHAARWVAKQGNDVHFMQMTSFGCGPDAFLLDEVKNILNRHGKSFTLLKIDDVNNIGSIKLRVRSVIESIKFGQAQSKAEPFVTTKTFAHDDRRRTILVPYFTDYISPLIVPAFKAVGYNMEALPESDTASADYGLMYANNEVCYPATLVVGDIIKALKTGKYDPAETAVIITQTGGQCRASNYIALIKKGVAEAGFTDVPVLSFAMGNGMVNEQSGFTINWLKLMPIALAGILFGDSISKFYHASAVREKNPGDALTLREKYLDKAKILVEENKISAIYDLIAEAAAEFDSIIIPDDRIPRVGVVGEIYLKFNSFAHKHVTQWLISNKIEIMPPLLINFFTQSFVNKKVRHETFVQKSNVPMFLLDWAYKLIYSQIKRVNQLAAGFRYFAPFTDIFEEAEHGKEVITLSAQFGEGWLLPAEIVSFAKQGVYNVISLQPFGCIANHIVSKGVEKRIKTRYPQMNILALDFDSGVSDVNVINRLMLMTNNIA